MTNNILTDERIAALFECVDMCDDMPIDENADTAKALIELQQRRAADKNFFMYGIAEPDGSAYMDEVCVSHDIAVLEVIMNELRASTGDDGYRIVALHTALPLTDSERAELQEYRKAKAPEMKLSNLLNKFYERYPLEEFASDSERAAALGYFLAGCELQCFGEFIKYEDLCADE